MPQLYFLIIIDIKIQELSPVLYILKTLQVKKTISSSLL